MNSHAVMTIFAAMDKTSGVLNGISNKIGGFQAKVRNAFANLIPGGKFLGSIAGQVAIGTLAVKGLTAAANGLKNTIASIPQFAANTDVIGKQSQILGLGAEELQRYQYAAKMSNVSQEMFAASFQRLNRSIGSGALFKSLEEMDKGLAAQIRQAKSTSEAFMIMTDAINKETNVTKRAALVNAAFGKSGTALIPMMQGGAEAMREMMEAAPNIISNRTIAIASVFGNTMTHVKEVIKSFTDTARSSILEAITPYVLAIKDWLDVNREFIKVKIQQFVQKVTALIQRLIPVVVNIVRSVQEFINSVKPFIVWVFNDLPQVIPIVAGVVGAFMALSAIKTVVDGVRGAIAAIQFLCSPIGIIVLIVAALIVGFILLASKVGGFKEALIVVGQTILKNILMPFNLLLSAISALFSAIGHVPGGDWAKTANKAIGSFQDKMNVTLTGSTSTLINSGLNYLTDPYHNARTEFLEKSKEAGDDPESFISTIKTKFDEMIKAQMGTTAAVDGLADNGSATSPAKLRWGAMGAEDFFEIQKLGI